MCYLCIDNNILTVNEIVKDKLKNENREYMEDKILFELKKYFVDSDQEKDFSRHTEFFLDNVIFKENDKKINIKNGVYPFHNQEIKTIDSLLFNESISKKITDFEEAKGLSSKLALVFKRYSYFVELFLTTAIYSAMTFIESKEPNIVYKLLTLERERLEDEENQLQKSMKNIEENYYEIKDIIEGDFEKHCLHKKSINNGLKSLNLPNFDFIKNKEEFYYILDKAINIFVKSKKIRDIAIENENLSKKMNDLMVEEVEKENKTNQEFKKENEEIEEVLELTPNNIAIELKKSVKGQDHIIDVLSLSAYHQLMRKDGKIKNRNKIIEMIIGDTGTGKTFMIRQLAELLGLPYRIIPVTSFTTEGWQGASLSEMLSEVFEQKNGEYSLIFFDEIDKTNNAQNDDQHNQVNTTLQNELLTVIEGQHFENGVDTSKMMFILGGSFDEFVNTRRKTIGFSSIEEINTLHDKTLDKSDFLKFGIKKELLGRIQSILQLNPLTPNIMKEILHAKNGFLEYYEEFFEGNNIKVSWGEDFIDYIVEEHSNKGAEFGARFLNDLLYKNLNALMVEASLENKIDENMKEILITKKLANI